MIQLKPRRSEAGIIIGTIPAGLCVAEIEEGFEMTEALSGAGAVSIWLEVIMSLLFAVSLIVLAELLARQVDAAARHSKDPSLQRADNAGTGTMSAQPAHP